MTRQRDFDALVQDWLVEGPAELSDRVIATARSEIHRTTQRRPLLVAWRLPMNTRLVAIAAAAAIVVAGFVGLRLFLPSDPGFGTQPTASPTPIDTPLPTPSATGGLPALTPEWDARGPAGDRVATRHPMIAPDGTIWVASGFDSVFWIFSPEGQLLETWGTPGDGEGEFNFVFDDDEAYGGVAFAPDESFYVVDTGNFRIHHFSADREFLGSRGARGTADGQFQKPVAIDVSEFGTVFVADAGTRSIEKYTSDLGWEISIAEGFAGPFIDEGGNDYVLTNRTPEGEPGVTEYTPDGDVQGWWTLAPGVEHISGVTRGPNRDMWVTSTTGPDGSGDPHRTARVDQFGNLQRIFIGGGEGIAVSDEDEEMYITVPSSPYLRKYSAPAPASGQP